MATLKEIAAVCGTSIATVSYVLSGRGDERRISQPMQEKVVRAAEELHYDMSARARRDGRPGISVYWPQKQLDSMLPSFIAGMNTSLSLAPVSADVSIHPYEANRLAEQSSLWMPGKGGASLIVSAGAADIEALRARKTPFPVVLLNRTLEGCSSVGIDHAEAGRLAAEYVLGRGESDIILVVPNVWLIGAEYRSRAVREYCASQGVSLRDTISCGLEIDDGYALGQRLLLENRVPRILISIYDTVALGLVQALKDAGVKIGEDVELVSMSMSYNSSNARLYRDLTMVDLRQVEVSIKGMNLALEMATHRTSEVHQTIVHPQLMPRC